MRFMLNGGRFLICMIFCVLWLLRFGLIFWSVVFVMFW